jgi:hypothetical protein
MASGVRFRWGLQSLTRMDVMFVAIAGYLRVGGDRQGRAKRSVSGSSLGAVGNDVGSILPLERHGRSLPLAVDPKVELDADLLTDESGIAKR